VTEFHLGFQTKKVLNTFYQAGACVEGNVTGFDILENFILGEAFGIIFQLHLVVEVECCLRIVVEIQVQLFSDFTLGTHIDVHVKIEVARSSPTERQNRILDFLIIEPEGQVNISLRLDIHVGSAEEPVYEAVFDIELRNRIATVTSLAVGSPSQPCKRSK
jgi:hypothetical protein